MRSDLRKLKNTFVALITPHDEDGDICVYKSFWSPSYVADESVEGLSPMILYADIVDSINPGNWEVAKTFYGEAVTDLLND